MIVFLWSISILSLVIWIVLLLFWGNFWRCDQRLDPGDVQDSVETWPNVCAIIPARDEADSIGQTVHSLLSQNYPGVFNVILVDDQSSDGTADIAHKTACDLGQRERLTILTTPDLPQGWAGKLWAVHTGVSSLDSSQELKSPNAKEQAPEFLLLTDADIVHPQGNLKTLIAKAVTEQRAMVSLMVQLHCQTFWEKALIPAFIFFFQKLYPFPWANNPNRKLAAAAGGCILVSRKAFQNAGGIPAIKDALIDDCSLAAAIKHNTPSDQKWGRIWLGLSTQTTSLRIYDTLDTIWTMVARTAFTQLGYSSVYLAGSVLGMLLVYLWPPIGLIIGSLTGNIGIIATAGLAWFIMAIAYTPTIRLYQLNLLWSLALPAVAFLYTLMTIDSALQYWQGKGGAWKGRVYPQKS